MRVLAAAGVLLGTISSANLAAQDTRPSDAPLRVGFVLLDGVYNSELMAPYDVFQHTVYHTQPGMQVCTVGRSRDPVRSFEGLRILPDHDFESAPPLDVLVVPSGAESMGSDLEDPTLIAWLAAAGGRADHVLSVCDGAFLLAEAGLLEGRACTTYPGDIAALQRRYPGLDVRAEVSFVVDGKAITGVGGAASYDPAMYLVEKLYGVQVAEGVGKGLVIDWRLDAVPHSVGGEAAPIPAPTSYVPGDRVEVLVEDAAGEQLELRDIVSRWAGVKGVILYVMGGGGVQVRRDRGGLWCEDTYNDLALMRRLVLDYAPEGIVFVPVMCPPVYHEERFGFDPGAFLGDEGERYAASRREFVRASQAILESGLLPFERVWFDPRFRLLANPAHGLPVGDAPAWQGRCKWYRDGQSYGTPTLWVLDADLRVYGEPFFGNNYEAEGGALRYTARDVSARLDRLLRTRG